MAGEQVTFDKGFISDQETEERDRLMRQQKSSRPLLKDLINSIVSVSITEYRNAIMQNHRGQNSLNTLLTVLLYMNLQCL